MAAKGHDARSVVKITGAEVKRSISDYLPNPDRSFIHRLKEKVVDRVLGVPASNIAEFESFIKSCEDAGDKVDVTWMGKVQYGKLFLEQQEKTHNAEQEKQRKVSKKNAAAAFVKEPFNAEGALYPEDYLAADEETQFLLGWKVVYVVY